MPGCGVELTAETSGAPTNLGEAAHIAGENDGKGAAKKSARFDSAMTAAQRDHFDNLIYVCGNCHTKIDAIPQGETDYPVALLQQYKKQHEGKTRQGMLDAFAEVGFVELEEATRWVVAVEPTKFSGDYSLLKVGDKIKKNNLSPDFQAVIAMGLGVAGEVARYVQIVSQTDPDFPERLKAGFLGEYWRLKSEGNKGSELFELMCKFAQQGFQKQAQRSAGLAVLIHFFETCEVFEK